MPTTPPSLLVLTAFLNNWHEYHGLHLQQHSTRRRESETRELEESVRAYSRGRPSLTSTEDICLSGALTRALFVRTVKRRKEAEKREEEAKAVTVAS